MEVIRKNWFTEKRPKSFLPALLMMALIYLMSTFYFQNTLGLQSQLAASGRQVFLQHEWWRLWTALFIHGDLVHLFSNSLLFFLFAHLLMGTFSWWFFPLVSFLVGGLTNLIVLSTLPYDVNLLGVSGVIHWMGAAWLTLYFFIDRRHHWRTRFGSALFLSLMLFMPDTYKPEVSYSSHFIGFVLGIFSALGYYALKREHFHSFEEREIIIEPEPEFDDWKPVSDQQLPAVVLPE